MDRVLRSSSLCCSCSGRELMQAHCSVQLRLPKLKSNRIHLRQKCNIIPGSICCRQSRIKVCSQSPKQRGGGTPNRDNEERGASYEGRLISSLVTYGLSGTLAVVGAAIARIDLLGQFRWLSTDDLLMGLMSTFGLIALEGVLLAPPYDRLLAGAGRPGAKAGAVGLQLRTAHVGELLSSDSVAATLVLQQACIVAAQVVRRPGLKHTSPLLEGGLVILREASKELLQRGFVFTFLAAWLADRAFEAGADDTLLLPLSTALLNQSIGAVTTAASATAVVTAAVGGVEVYMTDAVRYIVAVLMTASIMPLVANEAEAMRVGVASNLALIMVEEQQKVQAKEQRRSWQQQLSEAGSDRQEEGEVSEAYDTDFDSAETEKMLREYQLYDALGRCTSTGPPRLTHAFTLLRGLLRFGAPNLMFALTGNLAASFLASAVPQLLLLAYVLRGPMVLLEKPTSSGPPSKQQQKEGEAVRASIVKERSDTSADA